MIETGGGGGRQVRDWSMRFFTVSGGRARSAGGMAAMGLVLVLSSDASPIRADEPARPSNYTEAIPGTAVKFEMVGIPGGTFSMGSPPGEQGRRDNEGPRHPVAIRPFWMGRTEVTWDEYDEFRKGGFVSNRTNAEAIARDADAVTRPTPAYPDETRGYGRAGYPAIGISHHAAMEYCHWLSKKTGRRYRLPTEAEWEYAARAGSGTPYSFGEDASRLGDHAWYAENAEKPQPVGKKKPNPWGLHDIHGNVAEWCLDRYLGNAYSRFPTDRPTSGPVLPPGAAPFPHVARGGSWADRAEACRSAARRSSHPSWNQTDPDGSIWWLWDADFVGFRMARAVEEQDDLKGLRSRVRRPDP
ncbi:Serine/threonine-protein kinase pkn1 [Aquisphaera giovannonii]|uniref:Serine/threonine-protein kinase pkn1 n=1 Tax=Aquisphaera giovannonii TaxID=406548 RepID=A0A5B9WFW8_9BACT|nr:formylglycine-generating enzyme family protein [Aquisphaera giovannonii]QEH38905.1 Serine/threonine-protein kinase pkn1 [Aquisphaera giovannonii]